MDPQTLPAEELALYTSLKKQLKVAFEPLKVQKYRLNLLKCTDLEQLLDGKDPLKNVSDFPLWTRLWEAAIVLADYFAGQKPQPGTSLLELGAGLGASGLVAAAAGYEVTLTDYEERIQQFQRINAAASNLPGVRFEFLDWLNPSDVGQYDVIAGSEIIFRDEFFEPLIEIFKTALRPGGVILLSHDARRRSLAPFFEMAKKDFTISVVKRTLKSLEGDKVILLARLLRK